MQYPKPQITCQQSSIIYTILDSICQISITLRHSPVIKLQTKNKFGDQQLHQDVHCDKIVQKYLKQNKNVIGFASEQRPQFIKINQIQQQNKQNKYIVTYDPLDGSSIIDTNFTIGSIFSIWPYDQRKLIGMKLKQQKNAILSLYGPRTTVIFFNRSVNKVQQLTLIQNQWILSNQHLIIKPTTKMFSPGNLRAVTDNQKYNKIVQNWIQKQYTLRYTGGLVPDIQQIFIKGHGIFANVSSKKHKAKLRVLYQAAAVGFLVEKAEGGTLTEGDMSLMQVQVKTFDDRIQFVAGSKNQLEQFNGFFQK